MIDLNPKHLETIQRILAEHVPKCEVRAFGSRVKWTAKDYSDLDITIVGSEPLSLRQLRRLKEAFEESDIPIRVDVADWQSLSDNFKQVIAAEYEVIQKAEPIKENGQFGQIRRSWKTGSKAIADFVDIVMGQSPPGNAVSGDIGIPLLNGPTEFGPHHPTPVQFTTDARKIANPGDLLFCVRGSTTGRMNWADQKYAIGRGIAAFRHRWADELQPFVRAVIEFQLPELLAQATGSTFPSVSASQLAAIPYPNFSEAAQHTIAHILGTLDGKIELNRQMNETLEAIARMIFKSWFVDFDPVRAKMEGRMPAGMDAATATLFPSAFQDSPLGKIPKGWKVGTLGEIAENVRQSVKASEIDSDEFYIGLEHMPRRSIALSEWQIAGELGSNKYRFRKGEILFGKLRPYFHKVGVAPLDGVCSTDILVIQPIDSEWFGIVLGLVSSDEFIAYTNAYSAGTRMPRTNWKDMSKYEIALPQVEVSQKYTEFIRPFIGRIIENIHQSRTLSQIRDTLLPKLLSGEIRVDDKDERLEVKNGGTS